MAIISLTARAAGVIGGLPPIGRGPHRQPACGNSRLDIVILFI
jgi:hypothetical protein